ncbi:hypothetical protein [uncultured Erythrobacter sp.]|uniref:hypothetical protein n=1 Tax=uncultured Erythrobacter sp. TaxID=263913 RepID=UPI002603708E|nr:hypothetical protein [uncultured Erythrobacter sp.]
MKLTLSLLAAAGVALSVPAFADEPRAPTTEQAPQQTSEAAEAAEETAADAEPATPAPAPAPIEIPAIEAPEEEERICRRIRVDMSSRRATRVCMTRDEWREFNQRR